MTEKKSIYEELGVDTRKAAVKKAFAGIIDNEFKGAFVNIIRDPYESSRYLTMHQDGDGSKFLQRLLHFLEDGRPEVFRGMVDDAMSMNTGDIAAAGFVFEPWLITDVLNLGLAPELKQIIMEQIAIRFKELKELYASYGFKIIFLGGETADLPYQVRTGVFDIAITAWANRGDLILGNVQGGDIIFGFASDGKAAWEEKKNSGLMSNWITLARSALMSREYNAKYPFMTKGDGDEFFKGSYAYNKHLGVLGSMTVGEAILSPTRQWAILIKKLMEELKKNKALHMLHGISMNTGGGATKIMNVGKDIMYMKEMPMPPQIVQIIQQQSGEKWNHVYEGSNCGIGIDVVGENKSEFIDAVMKTSEICKVKHYHLGGCMKVFHHGENQLMLGTPFGEFHYGDLV